MKKQRDRNYRSYDGIQENVSNVVLDPLKDGWQEGSWEDTLKFYKRHGLEFKNFTIVTGGNEDGVDVSPANNKNLFKYFTVAGGKRYVLTLKGQSNDNIFEVWVITKPGKWVDVQIGNWSNDDINNFPAYSKNNIFRYWKRLDNKPVRYAYRFGCKPQIETSNFKHVVWVSIGITLYWYGKFALLKAIKLFKKD